MLPWLVDALARLRRTWEAATSCAWRMASGVARAVPIRRRTGSTGCASSACCSGLSPSSSSAPPCRAAFFPFLGFSLPPRASHVSTSAPPKHRALCRSRAGQAGQCPPLPLCPRWMAPNPDVASGATGPTQRQECRAAAREDILSNTTRRSNRDTTRASMSSRRAGRDGAVQEAGKRVRHLGGGALLAHFGVPEVGHGIADNIVRKTHSRMRRTVGLAL